MKHVVIIETSLTEPELHELLCKTIHEQDLDALNELSDKVEDIIGQFQIAPYDLPIMLRKQAD